MAPGSAAEEVRSLHAQARDALQRGHRDEAARAMRRVLELDADDPGALSLLGQLSFSKGELIVARDLLARAAQLNPRDPQAWTSLSMVQQRLGDAEATESALSQALQADPHDLLALLLRGKHFERQGRQQQAAQAYGAAATVAPPLDQLSPELRVAVQKAQAYRDSYGQRLAAFMDQSLHTVYAQVQGEDLERFKLSVDILLGRKQRFDSQPMRYFVPRLAPVEFFDRSHFPWLAELEAGTPQILEELNHVLREDAQSLQPYITYGADQPIAQWAELNHSPRWSAYHLWKDGQPVREHVYRCPQTERLLGATPRPDQPGRTPVSMFSLLKPQTRIPPHVGASNARLICHLPLVIPPGCGFRVGNSRREWVPGRAWVFDDTIEHEAWNDSDQLRAILIWDTWHPELKDAERRMITAMNRALSAFAGTDQSFSA